MTLDKPKTSFSFQGTSGSNSLLFFSFRLSCLLSEVRRRRKKSTSPLQSGHCVKFLFHTLWAPYQRPQPACRDSVGPASLGWAALLQRRGTERCCGAAAEAVGRVLGAAEPLPPGAAALEGADVHLWRCCPAQPHGPGEGLAGGGVSGWFGTGGRGPLPHLAVVIRALWPGRGRSQRGWCKDKTLSGWAHTDPTGHEWNLSSPWKEDSKRGFISCSCLGARTVSV